uniref:Peptidase C1A papain C-terminal domain-containing protein n=1 Tax=Stomoxys calcitrans TaxID=35570 RepID=A0A1I8Q9T7_STOCA
MEKLALWLTSLLLLAAFHLVSLTTVPNEEWDEYKILFAKVYSSSIAERNALYHYGHNKNLIDQHNAKYDMGQKTFKLAINQFTDMNPPQLNEFFPVAMPLALSHATPAFPVMTGVSSYNPADFGFSFLVEDQGTKCNSGWAYATAKAIEIMKANIMGDIVPYSLSAQVMIDCAGSSRSCIDQVPQTAFDYLTQYNQRLYNERDYRNTMQLNRPNMCIFLAGSPFTKLAQYSVLNSDEELKNYVSAGLPVVVEVNPTSFEFLHYSAGVFQPPSTTTNGSHFMTVIGYDADYWILQNSFGHMWGERGLMRMQKSPTTKLAKNAIFPTQLSLK